MIKKVRELNPRELKQAEEQIIKTAQQECFPDEIRALKNDKPLPSKGTLLKVTPKLYGGLLRSNTRLRYSEAKICQKRRSFQSSF